MDFPELDSIDHLLQINTQELEQISGDIFQALADEESWNQLSQELHDLSKQIVEETNTVEGTENSELDVTAFLNLDPQEIETLNCEVNNGFTLLKTKDESSTSDLAWSSICQEENYSLQYPSELYSPTSISRSTSPESNYDYELDVNTVDLFIGPVTNEFDKKIAQKLHQKENLENTLLIYQTSQGNNHLSQSQNTTDIDDVKVIIPQTTSEVSVPVIESNEIKRKIKPDIDNYEEDGDDDDDDHSSDYSPSKKRKTRRGDGLLTKRNNNKEAAKRYRDKKKCEFESDKMLKERLQSKNRELRKVLMDKIHTRKVLITLLKENAQNSNKPVILPPYSID